MQQLIRLCRFGDSYIVGASLKLIEEVFNMSKQPLQRLLALKVTSVECSSRTNSSRQASSKQSSSAAS